MLFTPLRFRTGLVARNRVVLAAMTNQQSHEDGSLGDDELRWLSRRARGGFGTITTCAAHVGRDGQGWPGELGAFDDALLTGLTRLAAALRAEGAAALVQLFHGGLKADPAVTGAQPWSAVAGDGWRAATTDDIERLIRQFGDAAARVEQAGFDGVEIHGAHGYVLTQFLSASNQRDDGWGGAFEDRARLIRAVTREVRRRTRPGFTVVVRLSPEDRGAAVGLDLDESLQTARWLAEDGADGVHLSLLPASDNTRKRPDEHAVTLFRAALPADVVVIVAGGVWTRAEAESHLARGADAVALARAGIVNPDWPKRARDDGWEPERPPVTVERLRALDLSAAFADYLRNWRGFIA